MILSSSNRSRSLSQSWVCSGNNGGGSLKREGACGPSRMKIGVSRETPSLYESPDLTGSSKLKQAAHEIMINMNRSVLIICSFPTPHILWNMNSMPKIIVSTNMRTL
jgi:hypothetical protein